MTIRPDVVDLLTGKTACGSAIAGKYTKNFGGFEKTAPAVLVHVQEPQDIVRALQVARQESIPISVRGSGHSQGNLAVCPGGILVINRSQTPRIQWVDDVLVEVDAGCEWGALEIELNKSGRSIPVLTNKLDVTIGGTLSVGGYGEGSLNWHGQIDLVRSFTLIQPDGTRVYCDPECNAPLFHHALAGVGQLGVIDRVTLRTVSYEPHVDVWECCHKDLPSLIRSLSWLKDDAGSMVDFFSARFARGRFFTLYGMRRTGITGASGLQSRLNRFDYRGSYRDWHIRSMYSERKTQPDDRCVSLWSDYVVDERHSGKFCCYVQKEVVDREALKQFNGRILLLAARRPELKRHYFSLEPISASMRDLVIGMGLYFDVERTNKEAIRKIMEIHAAVLEVCRECSGRPYLAGWLHRPEITIRDAFGASYDELMVFKTQLDPKRLLNRLSWP